MIYFASLLQNRNWLFRFTIMITIIPLLLSLLPKLEVPVFTAIFLINFMILAPSFIQMWKKFKRADPFLKLQYGLMGIAILITIWLIWVGLAMKPGVVTNTILAVITYLLWLNMIENKLDIFPYDPIFRGYIEEMDVSRSYDALVIPISVSVFVGIVAVLIESFIVSRGYSLLIHNSFRWLLIPGYITIHSIIHTLIIQELEWQPKNGITQYKELDRPNPPEEITPRSLDTYFANIERTPPHEKFFRFLDNNLDLLVDYFRDYEFAKPLHRLVRIYSYWGKNTTDQLHYLHLLIAASLSRFRSLGLIPMYNRYMFYSYLELLYKLQILSEEWIMIIEYEIKEQKDEFRQLDWIIDLPYSDIHQKLHWVSLWNGKIYRGQDGYELLREEQLEPHKPTISKPWIDDTWELVFDYLKIFVGPEGRKVLAGNLQFDDALDFLANKQTLATFKEYQIRKKEKLQAPKHRFVDTSESNVNRKLSEAQMKAYFDGRNYNDYPRDTGIKSELGIIFQRLKKPFSGDYRTMIKWLLIIVFAVVNITVLWFIQGIISGNGFLLIIAIEIVGFQFFSIPASGEGIMDEEQRGEDVMNRSNEQFREKQLESGLSVGSAESLLLTFILMFAYFLVFN